MVAWRVIQCTNQRCVCRCVACCGECFRTLPLTWAAGDLTPPPPARPACIFVCPFYSAVIDWALVEVGPQVGAPFKCKFSRYNTYDGGPYIITVLLLTPDADNNK